MLNRDQALKLKLKRVRNLLLVMMVPWLFSCCASAESGLERTKKTELKAKPGPYKVAKGSAKTAKTSEKMSLPKKTKARPSTSRLVAANAGQPARMASVAEASEVASGLYQLDAATDFNLLDNVIFNSATGQITLVGHRDPNFGGSPIPYLDHLAELLDHPAPEFSLNWTPESHARVEALFQNFNSPEYVRGLVRQWAEIMGPDGHPTGSGRWVLPFINIKPTSHGERMGYLGADVREVSNKLAITSVAPGSPADRAGLQPGDYVYNYSNASEFAHAIRLNGEGGTLMVQIQRDGRTGSPTEIVLDGARGDPWSELDKFDLVEKILWANGNNKGAMLVHSFAQVQRIMQGTHAGFQTAFNILVAVADFNDTYWSEVGEYNAGRLSQDVLLEHAFRAIFSAMERAFEIDDSQVTDTFDRARQRGLDSGSAFDEAIPVLNQRIESYLVRVTETLLATNEEIVVPPEVLARTIGPQLEMVPEYRAVDARSALARVLFSADYLGKTLINMPALQQKIPRYQSEFAFERDNPDKVGEWHDTGQNHLWFSVDRLDLAQSPDGNTLQTRSATMRINIREKLPDGGDAPATPGGYDELLTSLYDDFAREFPVLHELRETAKLTGVAHWLNSKRPGFHLPTSGRISWTGEATAPGILYLTFSPKERPGRLAAALSAMGGVRLRAASEWYEINQDTSVVDLRPSRLVRPPAQENTALVAKILRLPADVPVPQPVGWVNHETRDGQDITAVSIVPPEDLRDAPAAVQLQQDSGDKMLTLWKANDLDGAIKALAEKLRQASDPRAKASLMMMAAQLLHEKGEEAEAIKYLNEAAGIDPTNPMVHLLIAKDESASGNSRGAQEALQKYVSLDPGNQAAARLLNELRGGAGQGVPGAETPGGTATGRLAAFTPALNHLAGMVSGTDEAVKANSDLEDFHIGSFVSHGIELPPYMPPGHAKDWKQYVAKMQTLDDSSNENDTKLADLRARQARGEGQPDELAQAQRQLELQQAEIARQKEESYKKMRNDIVQWQEEEPEPPKDPAPANQEPPSH